MEWIVDPTEMLTNMGEEIKNIKNTKTSINSITKSSFLINQQAAIDALVGTNPPNNNLVVRLGYIFDNNSKVFDKGTIETGPIDKSRKDIKEGSIYTVGYNDTEKGLYTHFTNNFRINENGKYDIDTTGNNTYPLIMRQFAFIEVTVPNYKTVVYLSPFDHYCTAEFTQTDKYDSNQIFKVTNETVVTDGFDKLFLFISNNARDYSSSSICGELFKDNQEASWEIPFDCTDIKFLCKATDVYNSEKVSALYEECKNAKKIYLSAVDKVLSSLGLKDTIIDTSDLKEYLENYVDEYIKNTNEKEGIHAVISNLTNNSTNMVRKEINNYFDKDNHKKYNHVVFDTICKEMLKLHNAKLDKEEKQLDIDEYKGTIFNTLVEKVKATFENKEEPDVLVKTISTLLKEKYQTELQKYDTRENERKTQLRNKIETEFNNMWKSKNLTHPANSKELIEKEFEIRNLMYELMKNNVDLIEEDAKANALE